MDKIKKMVFGYLACLLILVAGCLMFANKAVKIRKAAASSSINSTNTPSLTKLETQNAARAEILLKRLKRVLPEAAKDITLVGNRGWFTYTYENMEFMGRSRGEEISNFYKLGVFQIQRGK